MKEKPKPGERKWLDGRYKDGVDKGRFSSNTIPLPLKPRKQTSIINHKTNTHANSN